MKKKIIFAVFAMAVLSTIFVVAEMLQAGRWRDNAFAVVVLLLLLVFQFYSFARLKPAKDARELGDDDGGIDWREEKPYDEVVEVWKGWAVLLDDVAVHEAKAMAEKLEAAHMRCRLELLEEDRAYHHYGRSGLGTRMCVLVAPSDYDAAKKLLPEMEESPRI